jgi:quercetin dioxygenase-like cupin family protein
MAHHIVKKRDELIFTVPPELDGSCSGFVRSGVATEAEGSTHMGFGVCELQPGGSVDAHVHSYEESFFVLEGSVVVDTDEGSFALRPGDYGVVNVGAPHAWRNVSDEPARWADMLAPMPRERTGWDTYVVPALATADPVGVDVRDPRTRSFGHVDPENMAVDQQTQDRLAVSASMRTALLVYSGITVKMMVDTDLGADLSTMFMVQYEPGGFAGAHDHPLEEAYLIIEGEVDATFDGVRYHMVPGDVAWAGVGCVHEFANGADSIVRWLETQAPQPPARHSYRFARDWTYLEGVLDGRGSSTV